MRKFLKRFKEGLFTKSQFLTGTALVAISLSAIVYAVQTIGLYEFTPNTPISAGEVNHNFNQVTKMMKRLLNGFSVSLDTAVNETGPYSAGFNFTSVDFNLMDYDYADQFVAGTQGFVIQEYGGYVFKYRVKNNIYSSCCSSIKYTTDGGTTSNWLSDLSYMSPGVTSVGSTTTVWLDSGTTVSLILQIDSGITIDLPPGEDNSITFQKVN